MQEQESFSGDDPEAILTRPRFGEEEERRARPVVPLSDGDAKQAAFNGGPRVAFRGSPLRSRPRHLMGALVLLVITAAIAMATALYANFGQANPAVDTPASTQAVEEPTLRPQSPAPPPPSQPQRADVVYAERRDEESGAEKDDEKGDKDSDKERRRKHSRRQATRDDDETKSKRPRRLERVTIEVRH